MCITSLKSILTHTYIGVWDIDHPQYGYRHVLSYQNRVQSLAEGPNCMLLHIQSKDPLTPDCLVDTSDYPSFLTDLEKAIEPPELTRAAMNWMSAEKKRINYVVEQGVYHIAILNDISTSSIHNCLQNIPEFKRPDISDKLFQFFKKQFPGYPLLLCCFDNKDAQSAAPILVHFNPFEKDLLLANTIDSHGGIPNLESTIDYHQCIIFGTCKNITTSGNTTYHEVDQSIAPGLAAYLPKFAAILDLSFFSGKNADILIVPEEIQKNKAPKIFHNKINNATFETKELQIWLSGKKTYHARHDR